MLTKRRYYVPGIFPSVANEDLHDTPPFWVLGEEFRDDKLNGRGLLILYRADLVAQEDHRSGTDAAATQAGRHNGMNTETAPITKVGPDPDLISRVATPTQRNNFRRYNRPRSRRSATAPKAAQS